MEKDHPPHIYLDNVWYFIAAATYGRARFFHRKEAKEALRDTLIKLTPELNIGLRAWVILDNHLLLKTKHGQGLSSFIARLHGNTSRQINITDSATGRRVWLNYWDSCIRTEADLWTRFNHIHQNPIKHGYVRGLEDYSFSSYEYYLRAKERAWLQDCLERYPVIDFLQGDEL